MIKTDIIGNLTQDPRTNTVNDTTFCNLRLASNKKRKNKEGNYEEETTFLNASAIGKPAETLGKYLSKGSRFTFRVIWLTRNTRTRKAIKLETKSCVFASSSFLEVKLTEQSQQPLMMVSRFNAC